MYKRQVVGWWWGKTFSKKMPDGDLVKGNVMAGTSGVDGGSWKAAMDIVEVSCVVSFFKLVRGSS